MPTKIHSALCNIINVSMQKSASINSREFQNALETAIEAVADDLGENTDGTPIKLTSHQESAEKLSQSIDFVVNDARSLHSIALRDENNFAAEMALDIIDRSVSLRTKINQYVNAGQ